MSKELRDQHERECECDCDSSSSNWSWAVILVALITYWGFTAYQDHETERACIAKATTPEMIKACK